MSSFTDSNGEERFFDTWYPLPFLKKGFSMLPVRIDSPLTSLLLCRTEEGGIVYWSPWGRAPSTLVEWMIVSPFYEI